MIKCDYCGNEARQVTGKTIYPHRSDLYRLKFWYCDNGHEPAYVGCHKNGSGIVPLGRLANAELRRAKNRAHAAFDPVWREGSMKRNQAYAWLALQLGISREECHIGMMDVEMCGRVVECVREMAERQTT